jgi:hypothetical protein
MLLPFMLGNLAPISRTWIAMSIFTGQVLLPQWSMPNTSCLSSHSTPSYIFNWNAQTNPGTQRTTTQSQQRAFPDPAFAPIR